MAEKQLAAKAAKPAVQIFVDDADEEPKHKLSPVAAAKPKIRPAKTRYRRCRSRRRRSRRRRKPVMSMRMYIEWRRQERLARVREERRRQRRRRRPEEEIYLDRESK